MRQRETDRQRQKERERERQTDRDTQRETETQQRVVGTVVNAELRRAPVTTRSGSVIVLASHDCVIAVTDRRVMEENLTESAADSGNCFLRYLFLNRF